MKQKFMTFCGLSIKDENVRGTRVQSCNKYLCHKNGIFTFFLFIYAIGLHLVAFLPLCNFFTHILPIHFQIVKLLI